MRSRLISVSLLLLLTVFPTSGTTQETGRIFCILVTTSVFFAPMWRARDVYWPFCGMKS
jgi:hypothetical protein